MALAVPLYSNQVMLNEPYQKVKTRSKPSESTVTVTKRYNSCCSNLALATGLLDHLDSPYTVVYCSYCRDIVIVVVTRMLH
jgi:hypothetical protein